MRDVKQKCFSILKYELRIFSPKISSVPVNVYFTNKTFFYSQGNNYFKQGNFDEAIKCYTRGMHSDPYNPVLPTNRASAFYRMKK